MLAKVIAAKADLLCGERDVRRLREAQ